MPDNLLRLSDVIARVSLGRSTIHARMKNGTFPLSRSISPSCVRWLESEINRWIESLPTTSPEHAGEQA